MKIKFRILAILLCSSAWLYGTNISGTISSNMTLDTAGSPWIVTGNISINPNVTLTVDSSVEVRFNSSRSMTVNGTLDARYATFTANSMSPTIGFWGFISAYDTVIMDNCIIEYASTGIYLYGGYVDLQDCTISECTWPISYITPSDFTESNLLLLNNTHQTVRHTVSTVSSIQNYALPSLAYPYEFVSDLTIQSGGSLTINAPNIFKMNYHTGIYVEGTLIADGELGNEIVFTSYKDDNEGGDTNGDASATSPVLGDWDGIYFQNSSLDAQCKLRYCEIKYGSYSGNGGVTCNDASPTINNCDLSNNYYGIRLNGASNATIDSCVIGSSSQTSIAMSFDANPTFLDNSFSFSDNNYDAIGLLGGTMTSSSTLPQRDVTGSPNVTYVLLGTVTIDSGVVLTINPGVVIKPVSAGIHLLVKGTLSADGTPSEPIVFTSIHDDNHGNPNDTNKNGNTTVPAANNWYGIVFGEDSSPSSLMDNCIINYGGTYSIYQTVGYSPYFYYTLRSNIAVIKSNPTISNCEFNIAAHGISCYKDAAPILTNNTINNATSAPIAVTADSDPVATGNTFVNAGLEAMGLIGTEIFANGTISQVDLAGYTNITYVLIGGSLVIRNGAYIDVEPGVVIKAASYGIRVEGGLKAIGTGADEIVITSTKDDNEGNPMDTNGDGNSTTPNYYDWAGIYYDDVSDDAFDSLKYVHIKYANNSIAPYYSGAGVHCHSADINLLNSTISNCGSGVGFTGNSSAAINQVTIENSNSDPLVMSLSANPQLSNITFSSNNFNTIGILDNSLASDATVVTRNVAGFTNIAYRQRNSVLTINAIVNLTISPDVVWKFSSSASVISVIGSLTAEGLNGNPVIFTSIHDDAAGGDSNNNGNSTVPASGNWDGIMFWPMSNDSLNSLQYCEFRYGDNGPTAFNGYNGTEGGGLVKIKDASVNIQNCKFNFSSYTGIGIYGSANPSIQDNEFSNISGAPIHLAMFSNPTFSGNTAFNLGRMTLDVLQETLSQSGTVPFRSFAGYDSITYYITYITIGSGTTITMPEGLVFKSLNTGNNRINVDGELQVMGQMGNPVVFTHLYDDDHGNPADSEQNGSGTTPPASGLYNMIRFDEVSDDSSRVDHALIRYTVIGVLCESASPTVSNTVMEHGTYGIQLQGVSSPIVHDNLFHDLSRTPLYGSLLNFLDTAYNNVVSGTTWKGLGVVSETLTQDYTLKKRTFAGQNAIPYVFLGFTYTIGTGAVLTIDTGVICKFGYTSSSSEQLVIQRGLQVNGGPNPGESVVFTTINDDFYGGDTNADGPSSPLIYEWDGLDFRNESIDALCNLNNLVIRGANRGIDCTNASPTITKARLEQNYYGLYASGSSNPILDTCYIADNTQYGVFNSGNSFTIKAENCYWGDCTGPEHTSNPGGLGDVVTDYVDFDPWSCDVILPLAGDVSLNGLIQAFDASLILRHLALLDTLTPQQLLIGDVSGAAGMTAYDASLILQYLVGIINSFPVESTNRFNGGEVSDIVLNLGMHQVNPGDEIDIPLQLNNVSNLLASEIILHYNADLIDLLDVELDGYAADMQNVINTDEAGIIRIMSAGLNYFQNDGILATLKMKIKSKAPDGVEYIRVEDFKANEKQLSSIAIDGQIAIRTFSSNENVALQNNELHAQVYPNPFKDALVIQLESTTYDEVEVSLYDVRGNEIYTDLHQLKEGNNTLLLDEFRSMNSGMYILALKTNKGTHQQLVKYIDY